jgi:hypothetical protein
MYPVSLFALNVPYSEEKSMYTCCLCEVYYVQKEEVTKTSSHLVAVSATSVCLHQQLFHHCYILVASMHRPLESVSCASVVDAEARGSKSHGYHQGCTNPRCQVTWESKFYVVAVDICGSCMWHFILLGPSILKWLLDLWKVCALLVTDMVIL